MSKHTFIYFLVLSIIVSFFSIESCAKPPESEDKDELFYLTVLHTNDVHARVLQFNEHGSTAAEDEIAAGEAFGGVARRATEIKRIREEKDNVILVDAGDQFQGTLFFTQYRGKVAQTFMNMLGYDAMTLGNHEFDEGPAVLADFITGLDFPVISANIDAGDDPQLTGLLQPSYVIEVGEKQVGIVGATTEDTGLISKPGRHIYFNDVSESLTTAVSDLENRGIDIIIGLCHTGLGFDKELAASIDGIDIIVGGHTHSLLSNTDEEAEGPYPVVVNSPSGDPVLIVTAQSWGKYLGELEVGFSEDGVAEEWDGVPHLLDNSIPEDETVLAKAMDLNSEVEPLSWLVVGSTDVDLVGKEDICRHHECNSGNFLCDVLLWETKHSGVQVTLFNGGGIRAGIPAGEITLAQVLEVLPFGDTLATLELKGSHLREVIEFGVSRAEDPLNEGTGRFLHVAGMRYAWDPEKPVGERVLEIEIQNEDGSYSPLDDDALYKIACSDYLRAGHDGFDILYEKAVDPYDFGRVISDIVIDYLQKYSPVSPQVDGRIERLK